MVVLPSTTEDEEVEGTVGGGRGAPSFNFRDNLAGPPPVPDDDPSILQEVTYTLMGKGKKRNDIVPGYSIESRSKENCLKTKPPQQYHELKPCNTGPIEIPSVVRSLRITI